MRGRVLSKSFKFAARFCIVISSVAFVAFALLPAYLVSADATQTVDKDSNSSPYVDYAPGLPDLTEIGLTRLMSLELIVTTIGKRERQLKNLPAAVHIITREEIIRSGAQNLADALRLAPGIFVAQMSANMFVVASRGLANEYSNKLTLLIDGRHCFNPVFGGVAWDAQDVIMEDIERIEVIRGPGDAVWGSNATNGVVNVVTKTSRETQSSYVQAGGGTHDIGFLTARDGGVMDNNTFYRVYAKADMHGSLPNDVNYDDMGRDGAKKIQGGFRLDGGALNENEWSFQGYAYKGIEEERGKDISYEAPYVIYDHTSNIYQGGATLVGDWKRELSNTSKLLLRSYYDRREIDSMLYEEARDTLDIDTIIEHNYQKHNFMWGVGYRGSYGAFLSRTSSVSLIPPYHDKHVASLFVQDEYIFSHDELRLQTSVKVEEQEIIGVEYQPSVKLLYKPFDAHTFWTSVTRATSNPSDADLYIKWDVIVEPPSSDAYSALMSPSMRMNKPAVYYPMFTGFGNKALTSEVVVAYELGWRYNISSDSSLDIALFYNDYDNVKGETIDVEDMFFDVYEGRSRLVLPLFRRNASAGVIYGAEIYGKTSPVDFWHLALGYSYLENKLDSDMPLFLEVIDIYLNQMDPRHKALFNSRVDISENWAWDVYSYYVGDLIAHEVPSYIRLDTRIGFKVNKHLELELLGQNLLDNEHDEYTFPNLPLQTTRAKTNVIARVNYRY